MTSDRFEKVMRTLDLAVTLQFRHVGMTTREIADHMDEDIRTTQRLMRSMEYYFPQLDIQTGDNGVKRYRIPNGTFDKLIGFSIDELMALETAAQKIDLKGYEDDAKLVRSSIRKIKALMKPDERNRISPDLESLLQAEGLIASPGPRRAIPTEHVSTLREAIKGSSVCELYYTKRDGTKRCERVHPYGFLYGHRHYLVAHNPVRADGKLRKIILSSIEKVLLTDEMFEVPEGFCLQEYAHQSFGVYFDQVYDVEWRFDPDAASTARDYIFHPDQTAQANDDGSLTIKFKAAGLQEMAWHLIRWGRHVTVMSPPELKSLIENRQIDWDILP
ncbi:helix-turn-helix transcriptional regulator [Gimibacter soli]|uniref:WYL domain-containing protein n=1 Tax=Gimibacter soli TaxID=3024400 RepID=A0AAF0BLJ0_9PROT|nr:WYL domain-containing protein [Gimibacter soli]WCL55544.1 WYL domain-containing protein [Gimibacter soli]